MKNKVREFRAAMNLTQADLAKALDVSRQTVNAIEREKYDPSLPLAFRIAALFDKRAEEVFIANSGRSEALGQVVADF